MPPTNVGIVPHTHWDREWYAPFQVFRARLVRLLDELLPLLEHDLSYARFLLDGQTVVVDDYLEVRPEAAETLRRAAASPPPRAGPRGSRRRPRSARRAGSGRSSSRAREAGGARRAGGPAGPGTPGT